MCVTGIFIPSLDLTTFLIDKQMSQASKGKVKFRNKLKEKVVHIICKKSFFVFIFYIPKESCFDTWDYQHKAISSWCQVWSMDKCYIKPCAENETRACS